MTLSLLLPAFVLSLSCSPTPQSPTPQSLAPAEPAPEGTFEGLWYDGQAEMNGYRWSGSRYGQMRTGEAVAIFVTENVGADTHVKVDRPGEHRGDVLTVMKLNLVRDFQTGLYDYNTMTSVFAEVGAFEPVKVSFSSAEWCGHVYEELDVRRGLELDVASYFQGESTETTMERRDGAVLGDHVFVLLRGLRGHLLAPGASRELPFVAGAFERRLRHVPASWGTLRVTRSAANTSVTVPAGTFDAVLYDLAASDGRTGRVAVEAAYPHRLLRWSWSRGGEVLDSAELTGTKRMKYWELHDEGQESLRRELGLGK